MSFNTGTSGTGIQVATFIDAPVAGLEYSSTSTSGVTDALGNFEYMPGEVVSFTIGNVALGSVAPSSNVVRPVDLVPDASSDTDERVTRILQTLQSVDDNDDLSDGIQISSGTREHMRTASTAPVSLASSETTDGDVESLLPTGTFTVTREEAHAHYEDHLDDDSNAHQGYTPPVSNPISTPVSTPVTNPVAQPSATSGRLLASNCFQCHGTGGLGGFERIRGGEAGEVYEYTGRTAASSIMAAHAQGFTQAQLDAIVSYLNQ